VFPSFVQLLKASEAEAKEKEAALMEQLQVWGGAGWGGRRGIGGAGAAAVGWVLLLPGQRPVEQRLSCCSSCRQGRGAAAGWPGRGSARLLWPDGASDSI
jgi:hypothetical protein